MARWCSIFGVETRCQLINDRKSVFCVWLWISIYIVQSTNCCTEQHVQRLVMTCVINCKIQATHLSQNIGQWEIACTARNTWITAGLTSWVQSICMYNEVWSLYRGLNKKFGRTPIFGSQYSTTLISHPWNSVNVIAFCTLYQFAATFDIPPQIAVNQEWRYIAILSNLTILLQCPNFSIKCEGFEYNELS